MLSRLRALFVVAGRSRDDHIRAIRWDGSKWGDWKNISPTAATGVPGFVVLDATRADLYYTDTVGSVIQIFTADKGQSRT